MAKKNLLTGVIEVAVAAAAVAGVCYLFRDDIKASKPYKDLDVDNKIKRAKTVVQDKTDTIKEKTGSLKTKVSETVHEKAPWIFNEDEIIDEDEIILDSETDCCNRDYVSLDPDEDEAKVTEESEEIKITDEEDELIPSAEEVKAEDTADTADTANSDESDS